MTVCNRCGKENQDHYKFCLGCGAELTAAPKPGGDMGMMKTMMADAAPPMGGPMGGPMMGGPMGGGPMGGGPMGGGPMGGGPMGGGPMGGGPMGGGPRGPSGPMGP